MDEAYAILVKVYPLEQNTTTITSDKKADRKRACEQYHANGNPDDPFVKTEFAEIQQTIRLEKENSRNGWDMFLRTPGNRKRLLLIFLTTFFSQCSGNGLVSYYIHDILNSVGVTSSHNQSLINGGLQLWSFFVAVGMALTVDKIGRRKLFLMAGVGMLVTFTIWTACSAVYSETGNTGAGSAVIAMIFLFYGVAGLAWVSLFSPLGNFARSTWLTIVESSPVSW
jgi:hypothetical protein